MFCVQCNLPLSTTQKKFCSFACQKERQWITEVLPRILAGKGASTRPLKRFVSERDGPGCSECGLIKWRQKPLTIQLDHVDGDSDNNDPKNLRLLCPNCHSQTETWCFRNKKHGNRKSTKRNKYLRNYQSAPVA